MCYSNLCIQGVSLRSMYLYNNIVLITTTKRGQPRVTQNNNNDDVLNCEYSIPNRWQIFPLGKFNKSKGRVLLSRARTLDQDRLNVYLVFIVINASMDILFCHSHSLQTNERPFCGQQISLLTVELKLQLCLN